MNKQAIENLPGGDLIIQGLIDLEQGIESIYSLLIRIGEPRLKALGVISTLSKYDLTPEHQLYVLLSAQNSANTHSRYNALIRKLVSFERAYELNRRLNNTTTYHVSPVKTGGQTKD